MSKCNMEKDDNGRFVDDTAYLPQVIGGSICDIFSEMRVPKAAGLDIVNCALGNELSEHCTKEHVFDQINNVAQELRAMFIDGGATEAEVNAGFQDVLEHIQNSEGDSIDTQLDKMLKGLAKQLGGDDNGKIH